MFECICDELTRFDAFDRCPSPEIAVRRRREREFEFTEDDIVFDECPIDRNAIVDFAGDAADIADGKVAIEGCPREQQSCFATDASDVFGSGRCNLTERHLFADRPRKVVDAGPFADERDSRFATGAFSSGFVRAFTTDKSGTGGCTAEHVEVVVGGFPSGEPADGFGSVSETVRVVGVELNGFAGAGSGDGCGCGAGGGVAATLGATSTSGIGASVPSMGKTYRHFWQRTRIRARGTRSGSS